MCTPRASASTSSGCAYSRSIRSRTRRCCASAELPVISAVYLHGGHPAAGLPGGGELAELRQGVPGDLRERRLARVTDPLLEGDMHDGGTGEGGEIGGGIADSPGTQRPGHGGGQGCGLDQLAL